MIRVTVEITTIPSIHSTLFSRLRTSVINKRDPAKAKNTFSFKCPPLYECALWIRDYIMFTCSHVLHHSLFFGDYPYYFHWTGSFSCALRTTRGGDRDEDRAPSSEKNLFRIETENLINGVDGVLFQPCVVGGWASFPPLPNWTAPLHLLFHCHKHMWGFSLIRRSRQERVHLV